MLENWARVGIAAVFSALTACSPSASEGTAVGDCTDGADNDGDGAFDCADPGCAGSSACTRGDGGVERDGGPVHGDAGDVPRDAGDVSEAIPCMLDTHCAVDQVCSLDGYCGPVGSSTCVIAECQDGFAATCDGAVTLDCTAFGGSCRAFTDTDGTAFSWCDCGMIDEDEGSCMSSQLGAVCSGGLAKVLACPAGSACGGGTDISCLCDGLDDGVCPDAACVSDPDCSSCTPSCPSSVECGDNGCGGSCGSCELGERCNSAGTCVDTCTPRCVAEGRVCGDDGCGGSCGTCTSGTCNHISGQCETICVPSCGDDQICGPDGCGGTCGSPCPSDRPCSRCPSGATCEAEYDCRCGFFSRVDYTVDGTGLDFSQLNNVSVELRHIALDGTRGTRLDAYINRSETSATLGALGCEPHAEVRRVYSMAGGVRCERTDTITSTSIVIPDATLSGGSCTVPPLE